MLGAGQEFLRRQRSGARILEQTRSTTIIRVKNETGGDLGRNTVVGLDGPIFTPTDNENIFLQEVTFRGITPDIAKHKRRYAVLLEPAPDGRIVRAYLAGLCQVKVDVADASHEYVVIKDAATDRMNSSRHGHARILWREGDQGYGYGYETGLQWAIVMLGVTGSSGAIGVAHGDINPRVGSTYGTGQVELFRSVSGSADSCGETVDVLNPSADTTGYGVGIPSGKYCAVEWDADDTAWVAPLECP